MTISTKPTKRGEREIDVFNPFYHVKRLKNVPLSAFEDEMWITLQTAHEREFIQVEFDDTEFLDKLVESLNQLYSKPDEKAASGEEWCLFYTEVISRTVRNNLGTEY